MHTRVVHSLGQATSELMEDSSSDRYKNTAIICMIQSIKGGGLHAENPPYVL